MQITEIKLLLEVLSSVGIEEAVFDPLVDENMTLVRGASSDKTVVVYSKIDGMFDEHQIAIQNVRALLSRFHLFDDATAVCSFSTNKGIVYNIDIKQGRKKATYKCARADMLGVPKEIPGDLQLTNPLTIDKVYADYITKATASMGMTGTKKERTISIKVTDGQAELNIWDGEDDSFVDTMAVDPAVANTDKSSWPLVSFQKVMRQSVENSGAEARASFVISEHGIAIFDMNVIDIMVVPVVTTS
jgi:hypothetical protein